MDKDRLTTLLDLLIPPDPGRGIPGAGELGLAATLGAGGGSLASAFRSVLSHAEAAVELTSETVAAIERDEPEAFAEVLRAVYMAYYARGDVRAALGLSSDPVHPRGYPVASEPESLMADLTAPVRARGPVYRPTPRGASDGR